MAMQQRLFIGGPMDGRRISVDEHARSVLALPDDEGDAFRLATQDAVVPRAVAYTCRTIAGNSVQHPVMVAPPLSGDDIIAKLLAGYRP